MHHTTAADPTSSIDRFAEVSALLADPFSDGAAVLRDAGLDAEGWRKVEESWVPRLERDEAAAERFGVVFERTLRALSASPAVPLGRPGERAPPRPQSPWEGAC
jgi:hypothetical protein